MERTILHIVGGNSRERAEQARTAFALGHHAEIYAGLDELFACPPREGMILAADDLHEGGIAQTISEITAHGIWLPVLATSHTPGVGKIVAAMKAGAIDYLELPLEINEFANRLEAVRLEAEKLGESRRVELEGRRLVACLSRRESEVLRWLSAGCSNKEIARALDISPRTVEVHRGNMMGKLGAKHPADAVRIWLAACGGSAEDIAGVDHEPPAEVFRLVPRPFQFAGPTGLRRQRQ